MEKSGGRTCTKCGEFKPADEFFRKNAQCKGCRRAYNKEWADRLAGQDRTCTKCGEFKKADDFFRGRAQCKGCERDRKQEWGDLLAGQDRTCTKCGEFKKADDFFRGRSQCKGCRRAYNKEWADRLAGQDRTCTKCGEFKPADEFFRKNAQCKGCTRARSYLRKYGITPQQHAQLYELQGGRCNACGAKCKRKDLCVDHCHRSESDGEMRVRALLCSPCNLYEGSSLPPLRMVLVACQKAAARNALGFSIQTITPQHQLTELERLYAQAREQLRLRIKESA